MENNSLSIEALREIAVLFKMDEEIYPLFTIAAFKASALFPGMCQRLYNPDRKGDDLIALRNYDGSIVVLFIRPEHVENPAMYENPIRSSDGPEYVFGINISKYILTNA